MTKCSIMSSILTDCWKKKVLDVKIMYLEWDFLIKQEGEEDDEEEDEDEDEEE